MVVLVVFVDRMASRNIFLCLTASCNTTAVSGMIATLQWGGRKTFSCGVTGGS